MYLEDYGISFHRNGVFKKNIIALIKDIYYAPYSDGKFVQGHYLNFLVAAIHSKIALCIEFTISKETLYVYFKSDFFSSSFYPHANKLIETIQESNIEVYLKSTKRGNFFIESKPFLLK